VDLTIEIGFVFEVKVAVRPSVDRRVPRLKSGVLAKIILPVAQDTDCSHMQTVEFRISH
jgi:hypothetical protein